MTSFNSRTIEKMSQNYDFLLKCGLQSDVVLVAGEKEFHAHKKVLSARSPVFAAMFAHKSTKEAQENRVQIVDVDEEVLELLLRYIYTGKIAMLDRYVVDLFVVADMYQVNCLKSICEERLLADMSIQSVSDLLILADMHPTTDLLTECLDFIAHNATRVIASKGWKNVVVRADLMDKICARMHMKFTELMIVDNDKKIFDSNETTEKGNSANWTSRAAKLFITAHKHKMDSLKSIFRQQLLSEEITTQSVSDLFIFADMHQITELATKCLDYITDNGTQVMASEQWKKIAVRADLLAKLFGHLSMKYKSVFDEQL